MAKMTAPARYAIRVRGVLSETLLCAFPGLNAQIADGDTVLDGVLPDQAALYGVLGQIEALGIELLEVQCFTQPVPRRTT